jgi:peptidoglycan-N-acetylglucosamine deacetylase
MNSKTTMDFITLIVLLVSLATTYMVIPYVAKVFMRSRFAHIARKSGSKFLTFDDGPDPISTPQILDILDEFQVSATFFVIGERAKKYPLIIKDIISRGHEIGEHGYAHLHPWTSWPCEYLRELVRSNRTIRNVTGSRNRVVFRPPYGKLNLFTLMYVLFTRRRMAFWDIDPRDYENLDARSIASDILEKLNRGSVVLMHDGRIDPGTNNSDLTVRALKLIINEVVSGVRFRSLKALEE